MTVSYDENTIIKELNLEIELLQNDKGKLKNQINKLQKINKMKSSHSYIMNNEAKSSLREINLEQKIKDFQ